MSPESATPCTCSRHNGNRRRRGDLVKRLKVPCHLEFFSQSRVRVSRHESRIHRPAAAEDEAKISECIELLRSSMVAVIVVETGNSVEHPSPTRAIRSPPIRVSAEASNRDSGAASTRFSATVRLFARPLRGTASLAIIHRCASTQPDPTRFRPAQRRPARRVERSA